MQQTGSKNGTAPLTMRERGEPQFVQFKAGDTLEGILTSVERIKVHDKGTVRYTIDDGRGVLFSFLGTYQLNTKLRVDDVGHWVKVHYVGEDTNVRRGDNNMRVFEVSVSDELVRPGGAASVVSDLGITDEDIPF